MPVVAATANGIVGGTLSLSIISIVTTVVFLMTAVGGVMCCFSKRNRRRRGANPDTDSIASGHVNPVLQDDGETARKFSVTHLSYGADRGVEDGADITDAADGGLPAVIVSSARLTHVDEIVAVNIPAERRSNLGFELNDAGGNVNVQTTNDTSAFVRDVGLNPGDQILGVTVLFRDIGANDARELLRLGTQCQSTIYFNRPQPKATADLSYTREGISSFLSGEENSGDSQIDHITAQGSVSSFMSEDVIRTTYVGDRMVRSRDSSSDKSSASKHAADAGANTLIVLASKRARSMDDIDGLERSKSSTYTTEHYRSADSLLVGQLKGVETTYNSLYRSSEMEDLYSERRLNVREKNMGVVAWSIVNETIASAVRRFQSGQISQLSNWKSSAKQPTDYEIERPENSEEEIMVCSSTKMVHGIPTYARLKNNRAEVQQFGEIPVTDSRYRVQSDTSPVCLLDIGDHSIEPLSPPIYLSRMHSHTKRDDEYSNMKMPRVFDMRSRVRTNLHLAGDPIVQVISDTSSIESVEESKEIDTAGEYNMRGNFQLPAVARNWETKNIDGVLSSRNIGSEVIVNFGDITYNNGTAQADILRDEDVVITIDNVDFGADDAEERGRVDYNSTYRKQVDLNRVIIDMDSSTENGDNIVNSLRQVPRKRKRRAPQPHGGTTNDIFQTYDEMGSVRYCYDRKTTGIRKPFNSSDDENNWVLTTIECLDRNEILDGYSPRSDYHDNFGDSGLGMSTNMCNQEARVIAESSMLSPSADLPEICALETKHNDTSTFVTPAVSRLRSLDDASSSDDYNSSVTRMKTSSQDMHQFPTHLKRSSLCSDNSYSGKILRNIVSRDNSLDFRNSDKHTSTAHSSVENSFSLKSDRGQLSSKNTNMTVLDSEQFNPRNRIPNIAMIHSNRANKSLSTSSSSSGSDVIIKDYLSNKVDNGDASSNEGSHVKYVPTRSIENISDNYHLNTDSQFRSSQISGDVTNTLPSNNYVKCRSIENPNIGVESAAAYAVTNTSGAYITTNTDEEIKTSRIVTTATDTDETNTDHSSSQHARNGVLSTQSYSTNNSKSYTMKTDSQAGASHTLPNIANITKTRTDKEYQVRESSGTSAYSIQNNAMSASAYSIQNNAMSATSQSKTSRLLATVTDTLQTGRDSKIANKSSSGYSVENTSGYDTMNIDSQSRTSRILETNNDALQTSADLELQGSKNSRIGVEYSSEYSVQNASDSYTRSAHTPPKTSQMLETVINTQSTSRDLECQNRKNLRVGVQTTSDYSVKNTSGKYNVNMNSQPRTPQILSAKTDKTVVYQSNTDTNISSSYNRMPYTDPASRMFVESNANVESTGEFIEPHFGKSMLTTATGKKYSSPEKMQKSAGETPQFSSEKQLHVTGGSEMRRFVTHDLADDNGASEQGIGASIENHPSRKNRYITNDSAMMYNISELSKEASDLIYVKERAKVNNFPADVVDNASDSSSVSGYSSETIESYSMEHLVYLHRQSFYDRQPYELLSRLHRSSKRKQSKSLVQTQYRKDNVTLTTASTRNDETVNTEQVSRSERIGMQDISEVYEENSSTLYNQSRKRDVTQMSRLPDNKLDSVYNNDQIISRVHTSGTNSAPGELFASKFNSRLVGIGGINGKEYCSTGQTATTTTVSKNTFRGTLNDHVDAELETNYRPELDNNMCQRKYVQQNNTSSHSYVVDNERCSLPSNTGVSSSSRENADELSNDYSCRAAGTIDSGFGGDFEAEPTLMSPLSGAPGGVTPTYYIRANDDTIHSDSSTNLTAEVNDELIVPIRVKHQRFVLKDKQISDSARHLTELDQKIALNNLEIATLVLVDSYDQLCSQQSFEEEDDVAAEETIYPSEAWWSRMDGAVPHSRSPHSHIAISRPPLRHSRHSPLPSYRSQETEAQLRQEIYQDVDELDYGGVGDDDDELYVVRTQTERLGVARSDASMEQTDNFSHLIANTRQLSRDRIEDLISQLEHHSDTEC